MIPNKPEYLEFNTKKKKKKLGKVVIDIKWKFPEKFKNLILCLGGMHLLMPFIGWFDTLMTNSVFPDL